MHRGCSLCCPALISSPLPWSLPEAQGQCKLSAQGLSGQAGKVWFWLLRSGGVLGFGRIYNTRQSLACCVKPTASLRMSRRVLRCWATMACSFWCQIIMIHVLPWHHLPLKTWASDPAHLLPKHLAKRPAACLPFTSNLCAGSATCRQPLPHAPGPWLRG